MPRALAAADRDRLLAGRDLSVDLVRVCCVLLVVVLHSLMLGLTVGPDGAVGWRSVVQEQPWFPVGVPGTRLMTVYLWHLLLVIAVAATVLAWPAVVPAVGTTAWWLARIPGDLSVLVVRFVLSLGPARFERGPRRVGPTPPAPALAVAGVLAVVPPFWAMQIGLDPVALAWGAGAMAAAVLIARGRPAPAS
ncbi:hypothetical protein [Amnibacterium kyonggiense]